MKNLVLILLLFVPLLVSAQQKDSRLFALRPNGFRALPDTSKGYIVVDVPGVTKEELYKRALRKINQIYNNPKFVTAAIDGQSINVHARQSKVFHRIAYSSLDIDYSFEIAFKDGKFKIEPLHCAFENFTGDQILYLIDPGGWLARGVFNKDGSLQDWKAKQTIDTFFNNVIKDIKEAILTNPSNDW